MSGFGTDIPMNWAILSIAKTKSTLHAEYVLHARSFSTLMYTLNILNEFWDDDDYCNNKFVLARVFTNYVIRHI